MWNNILNFQESTTILNACTKKVWKLIECNTKIDRESKEMGVSNERNEEGSSLGQENLGKYQRNERPKLSDKCLLSWNHISLEYKMLFSYVITSRLQLLNPFLLRNVVDVFLFSFHQNLSDHFGNSMSYTDWLDTFSMKQEKIICLNNASCIRNVSSLKLLLPRQKWRINETLKFFEILPIAFNTLIEFFHSSNHLFYFPPHPQIITFKWIFSLSKPEKNSSGSRSCVISERRISERLSLDPNISKEQYRHIGRKNHSRLFSIRYIRLRSDLKRKKWVWLCQVDRRKDNLYVFMAYQLRSYLMAKFNS